MEQSGVVAERVALAVLEQYSKLPKKGKCSDSEWTVLAGFVAVVGGQAFCLSLATGTKCLPKEQVGPHVLSDSHAEVLARRALCLRLIQGRERELAGVLLWNQDGSWNAGVKLYLYTSKEPCGSSRSTIDEEQQNKRVKLDVGCTVRKPGRGSATDCDSCADKLSKWAALGLLGKRSVASPVLAGIVVGGSFESRELLAQLLRLRECPETLTVEHVLQIAFEHDEREGARPSGLAINWIEGETEAEVTQPNGKKMGATSSSSAQAVNPKHVSRLAPIHRIVVAADYENKKQEWKKRVGY